MQDPKIPIVVVVIVATVLLLPAAASAGHPDRPTEHGLMVSATGGGSLTPLPRDPSRTFNLAEATGGGGKYPTLTAPTEHGLMVSATGGGSLTPLPREVATSAPANPAAEPAGSSLPWAAVLSLIALAIALPALVTRQRRRMRRAVVA